MEDKTEGNATIQRGGQKSFSQKKTIFNLSVHLDLQKFTQKNWCTENFSMEQSTILSPLKCNDNQMFLKWSFNHYFNSTTWVTMQYLSILSVLNAYFEIGEGC